MAARLVWKEDLLTLRAEGPVSLKEYPRIASERALAATTVAVRHGQADLGRELHSPPLSG